MSDQRMNASDQGTQPDSGSAPNDQVAAEANAGKHRSAPQSSGTQPLSHVPDNDEHGGHGWDNTGRDNIESIKG
ncbi:MAG: hypothetical protein ABI670_03620 [Chloroflexota bacterium]